ncbi:protein GVQW3-like [Sipha flava]|uniref:Protein GVQW3-like n=1 Tax=Sipha flava TaxID=143950 RepID=A0A8B8FJ39_9HEMI|nr:protein GVQW3-like [Sipha flava]
MDKLIENAATCELRSVIRFLNAENIKPVDIHRQICEVYGENAMSDSMVRRWVRLFKEGRTNVHDEERTGRPSLISGQNFNEDDEVKKAISAWLQSQASSFYDEGIQKLVPRYDKCLNNGGNYVEK